jgi:hypothetical protein
MMSIIKKSILNNGGRAACTRALARVHNQHSFIDDVNYQKTHLEQWRQSRLHEGVSLSA